MGRLRAVEGGRGRSRAVAAVAAIAAAAACATNPDQLPEAGLVVTEAYAAEPVTREVGAVYLTIENRTDAADTLVSAWTPVASMVHFHRMTGRGGARMRTQDVAEVPAGGRLQLRPGGLHLMLMSITAMPQAGDTIDITLNFRNAGAVLVRAPVVSYLEVNERATVGGQGQRQ